MVDDAWLYRVRESKACEIMNIITIFGRTVAVVPIPGMASEQDAAAQFINCEGEDFDLIFFDPGEKNLKQTILHELIHGVIFRTAIYQGNISEDLIEVICDNVATFITETFDLTIKTI